MTVAFEVKMCVYASGVFWTMEPVSPVVVDITYDWLFTASLLPAVSLAKYFSVALAVIAIGEVYTAELAVGVVPLVV